MLRRLVFETKITIITIPLKIIALDHKRGCLDRIRAEDDLEDRHGWGKIIWKIPVIFTVASFPLGSILVCTPGHGRGKHLDFTPTSL